MKDLLLIVALSFAIAACGSQPTANREANAAKSPPVPTLGANAVSSSSPSNEVPPKIVDTPSLIGKTEDQVKKLIPMAPNRENPRGFELLEYEMRGSDNKIICMFTVTFDKGKFIRLSGDLVGGSVATPEEMGDLLGVDLRTATKTPLANGNVGYPDLKVKGVTLHTQITKKDQGYASFVLDTRE